MDTLRRSCLLLAATGLLAGCAVGPDYKRPDTQTPQAYRGQTAEDSSTQSLADVDWWDLYSDPALTALVRQALAHNYTTKIAAARLEEARGLAMQATGHLYPGIGYTAEGYRGQNTLLGNANPSGNGTTGNGFAAFLSAAWEPDIWGRLRRLNEAARDQYLQTDEARRGIQLSLVSDVASAYFQLLELDQELAIAKEADKSFGESLNLFNERLKGGAASRLETASAEAAQAASAARVPLLERSIVMTENQLSILLGENGGPIARGAPLAEHTVYPSAPVGLPSQLLERRPDVRSAEFAAMAANANIGATIGSFLPRIGLSAAFGGVSPKLNDLTNHKQQLWDLGGQVTGPIFQAGALRGEYLTSKAQWEEAKLNYEQVALSAFVDVSNALTTRQKLESARGELEREVKAYELAVHLATERYKAGQASYYELLQEQQLLYPAQDALAQAERDELISVIALYKALGGAWDVNAPAPSH